MKNVLIIDGYSLFFRAYYANTGLKTKSDVPIGGIYIMCKMIMGLLNMKKYDFVVVSLDSGEKTIRHDIYENYKGNRKEAPDDLKVQFPILNKMINAMGLQSLTVKNYEADDIIYTMCNLCNKNLISASVTIATSDKDMMQLVSDDINIEIYDSFKKKFFKSNDVLEKMGVYPNQIVDFLSLTGDSVDNVPGASGIGQKTAIMLMQKFGNIESMYNNINDLTSESIKNKLLESKENVFLSKKLIQLRNIIEETQEMHGFDLQNFAFDKINMKTLENFGIEYDFQFLAKENSEYGKTKRKVVQESKMQQLKQTNTQNSLF